MNLTKSIAYFIGLFFIALPLWTDKYFGTATLSQLLFTIQIGLDGVLTADPIFVKRFIKWCLAFPLMITILLVLLERKTTFLQKTRLYFITLIIGLLYFTYQFSVIGFIKAELFQSKTDYYAAHYLNPNQLTFKKTPRAKSLVLIYVESLENTYSDKNIFETDLLKNLSRLKEKYTTFNHYQQITGSEWTIAGLISTQCGVPLKNVTIFGNNRQGEQLKTFLSKTKCLGDILAEQGYKNVFLNGPDLNFAGVGHFFKNHQYTETYGRKEWLAKGMTYNKMNEWGLYDDDLFAEAKTKLTALIRSQRLFNLTLLTIDSHGMDGYLSRSCQKQGYNDFPGIIECTANQVADFVAFIEKNNWLDKLNIVIVGDHLAMKNAVYDKLLSNPSRTVFNLIISKNKLIKSRETVVPFDMLPTILDITGIQYSGAQVALGYSAVITDKTPPTLPANRTLEMEEQITHHSAIYNQLW